MVKGKSDFKYGFTFLNVINTLHLYSKNREIKKDSLSLNTAIVYLKNMISIKRFTENGLKYDLENIVGGVNQALSDAVDFNKIMPPEYKTLQVWDKQIQILESVKQGQAKQEDIKESIDFFRVLSDGYHTFVDQNRYNVLDGAVA